MQTIATRTRAAGALSLATVLGGFALAVASVATQPATAAPNARAYCESYARQAVQQSRLHAAKQCGGGGAMWSPSYATHLYHCLRTTQAMTERLKAQRQRALAQRCGNGSPGDIRVGRRG